MNHRYITSSQCEHLARRGDKAAVDILINALSASDPLQVRVADYALGLVESAEGVARIRHHLFRAPLAVQRNHAALYFKRRGLHAILEEALEAGAIDAVQARSR